MEGFFSSLDMVKRIIFSTHTKTVGTETFKIMNYIIYIIVMNSLPWQYSQRFVSLNHPG